MPTARRLAQVGRQLVVVDTESPFLSSGFAREVALAGRGRYYRLPLGGTAAGLKDPLADLAAAAATGAARER